MLLMIALAVLMVLGAGVFWKSRSRRLRSPQFDQMSREDQVSYMRNQQSSEMRQGSRDSIKGLGAGRGSLNGAGWGP